MHIMNTYLTNYVFLRCSLKMPRNKTNIVTTNNPSVPVGILKYYLLLKASKFLKEMASPGENQDGGVGRHTAPPRTTRTDRKSNSKEVRHQGNKK